MRAIPFKSTLCLTLVALLFSCSTPPNHNSATKTEVPLASIANISPIVLAAQGHLVEIDDPVQSLPHEGLYIFSVYIKDQKWTNSDEREYEFIGDAEAIAHFVRELTFVKEEHANLSGEALSFSQGAVDDVEGMVTGLLKMVFHPIDAAVSLVRGGRQAYGYIRDNYHDTERIREDAKSFLKAYTKNIYMQQADAFHLNYEELRTPEAKAAIQGLGKAKMAGAATVEVVTLFVAWLKVGKPVEAAKLVKLGVAVEKSEEVINGGEKLSSVRPWANAFEFAEKAEEGASRMAKSATIAQNIRILDRLEPLLNPAKIGTLKGERALNQRLHKVIYYLHQAEKEGKDVSETLTRAMKMAGADKRISRMYLDPKIDHAQIMNNYKWARAHGLFEDEQGLLRMKNGNAPFITTPKGREIIEVDHDVPVSWASELGNSWGNLSYVPKSYNRARRDALILRSLQKLNEYKDAQMFSQQRLDDILRRAVKLPAPTP